MMKLEDCVNVEKAEFKYSVFGMGMCSHNYKCAVCLDRSAVFDINKSVLLPCWTCQKKGYQLVKLNWLTKILSGKEQE